MEQVTFAQCAKRLDKLLRYVADYEAIEADYLIFSQQMCFDIEGHVQFHAAYLRYRDVLIPQAKKEYEELHDQFKRLDEMSFRVADYEQSEADNLDYSQQKCFDTETSAILIK